MKKFFFLILLFFTLSLHAQSWGDQGDGSFRNPILPTDLSDPDVIRVKDKYYMVASDFHFLANTGIRRLGELACSDAALPLL